MPYRCGSRTIVAWHQDARATLIPMRCRRWDCPSCGPRQRRLVRNLLLSGNPTGLLTLTCSRSQHPDPDAAYRVLTVRIAHLVKRIRRHFPHNRLEYGLVWERTKAGWPHAHILLRGPYIPQRLISAWWADLASSPIVDIRAVHNSGQVAAYISKYLTKAAEAPPGMKRYRTSRQYCVRQPPRRLRDSHPDIWTETWRTDLYGTVSLLLTDGWTVTAPPDGPTYATPPPHPQPTILPPHLR